MKLILGLNKNECRMLFHFLGGDKNVEGLEEMGRTIADRLAPYCLLLHDDRNALAIQSDQVAGWSSFYSPEPVTLTGAGDHLGAGFCLGQLMQLSLSDSVLLGNAMAGCWVHKGLSANQNELLDFLDRLFDK
jgi:fructose-1-phosphate kinase PfkB-like protein